MMQPATNIQPESIQSTVSALELAAKKPGGCITAVSAMHIVVSQQDTVGQSVPALPSTGTCM